MLALDSESSYQFCRIPCNNGPFRKIVRHHGSRPDFGVGADRSGSDKLRSIPDRYIVPDTRGSLILPQKTNISVNRDPGPEDRRLREKNATGMGKIEPRTDLNPPGKLQSMKVKKYAVTPKSGKTVFLKPEIDAYPKNRVDRVRDKDGLEGPEPSDSVLL